MSPLCVVESALVSGLYIIEHILQLSSGAALLAYSPRPWIQLRESPLDRDLLEERKIK